jgi:hypothetical protein
LAKLALDQQPNTGLGFFFAICVKTVQEKNQLNHEKRWKSRVAIRQAATPYPHINTTLHNMVDFHAPVAI